MRRYIIFIFLAVIAFSSCSIIGNDDVTLAFQSSAGATTSSIAPKTVIDTGIDVTEFRLSIKEVEFKVNESDPSDASDVFFAGPYELNLLDATGPLTQTIGEADVPAGAYEEVRFKLHKTRDVAVDSVLYDRSIYLAGTINGTAFEMWHDTSENLDIGKATGIVVGDAPLLLTVDFSLLAFFDQTASGGALIDLSTATDEDDDGTIEINPNSDDGTTNKDLADSLKDNIKLVADIIES